MKKTTLFISSLVLSTVLVFGQSARKAAPITKTTQLNAIDEKAGQVMFQNSNRTPSGHIRCATTEMEQLRRLSDPSVKSPEELKAWINQIVKANENNSSTQKASRNIPIVVHVIHNGDALGSNENISDAQVISQITALNKDFSATNPDYASTPSVFNSVKGNMDIQFCLATTNPSGGATTGIDRVQLTAASYNSSTAESMKPGTQWDPTKYFNIWVINFGNTGLLGYAQFPNSGAANTDGVVIDYRAFGTTGTASAPYNKGRTATHEIGHCFGLFHIWGDDGTACTGSDNVADTPNQADENYGCPNFATNTSCGNTGDMSMNYMDYTDDACMYMFTAGQKAVVDAVLASAPRRSSLLTSPVCSAATITANFTGAPTTINAGQTVTFTDASTSPATLNSWAWTFTGGTPSSFNGKTPGPITYNTAGTYTVTLVVGDNASGTDTETKTAYITVNAAGTVTCDSTVAGWNWNTENFGGAYWTQDPAACNTPLEGYIIGNNCYDDNGWATKVTSPVGAKELVEVRYVFVQSTGTGGAKLKIWNANGTGGKPNTVLASTAITTGQFSANLNQFISVPISPAIPMSATAGAFFIGYDHDVTPLDGDTIVMGVADATTNTIWAKETGGWLDLSAYSVLYKATAVAIVCDISTGVQSHISDLTSIVAYPNPTTGILEVMLPKNNGTVKVYNMIGEEVANTSTTSNMMKVDLSKQSNGVYFAKITSNGVVTTEKIILSK